MPGSNGMGAHDWKVWGSKGGTVVRALASHQCGPGSNPGVNTICGLSLLLVLFLAPRGFPQGRTVFPFPRKPALPNSNSIWNAWTRFNEFLRTPKCSVGKQITNYKLQLPVLQWHVTVKELALPNLEAHRQLGCPSQPSTVLNECYTNQWHIFQSPYPLQVKRNSRQKWKFYSWKNTVYWN